MASDTFEEAVAFAALGRQTSLVSEVYFFAGVADRTQDDILRHSCKTMTAHYSMAQLGEIFEAQEKVKDETNRWNVSCRD